MAQAFRVQDWLFKGTKLSYFGLCPTEVSFGENVTRFGFLL